MKIIVNVVRPLKDGGGIESTKEIYVDKLQEEDDYIVFKEYNSNGVFKGFCLCYREIKKKKVIYYQFEKHKQKNFILKEFENRLSGKWRAVLINKFE